jgi:hypothetical protein
VSAGDRRQRRLDRLGRVGKTSGLTFTVWLVAGEVDVRTGEGQLVGRRLNRDGLLEVLRTFL